MRWRTNGKLRWHGDRVASVVCKSANWNPTHLELPNDFQRPVASLVVSCEVFSVTPDARSDAGPRPLLAGRKFKPQPPEHHQASRGNLQLACNRFPRSLGVSPEFVIENGRLAANATGVGSFSAHTQRMERRRKNRTVADRGRLIGATDSKGACGYGGFCRPHGIDRKSVV